VPLGRVTPGELTGGPGWRIAVAGSTPVAGPNASASAGGEKTGAGAEVQAVERAPTGEPPREGAHPGGHLRGSQRPPARV
jgi:hypothetical protein